MWYTHAAVRMDNMLFVTKRILLRFIASVHKSYIKTVVIENRSWNILLTTLTRNDKTIDITDELCIFYKLTDIHTVRSLIKWLGQTTGDAGVLCLCLAEPGTEPVALSIDLGSRCEVSTGRQLRFGSIDPAYLCKIKTQ